VGYTGRTRLCPWWRHCRSIDNNGGPKFGAHAIWSTELYGRHWLRKTTDKLSLHNVTSSGHRTLLRHCLQLVLWPPDGARCRVLLGLAHPRCRPTTGWLRRRRRNVHGNSAHLFCSLLHWVYL